MRLPSACLCGLVLAAAAQAAGLSDGRYTVNLDGFGSESMKHIARTTSAILHLERRGGSWVNSTFMTDLAIGAGMHANEVAILWASEAGRSVEMRLAVGTDPMWNVTAPNVNTTLSFTVPEEQPNATWHCQARFGHFVASPWNCSTQHQPWCQYFNGSVCNAFYWDVFEPVA